MTNVAQQQISLRKAENRAKVQLLKVEAGQKLKARLAAMGLLPGVKFIVINNGFPGPSIIDLKGCRIVLGRGMAGKIFVRPIEG
jgi:Fe2+ transport system protein FeoA